MASLSKAFRNGYTNTKTHSYIGDDGLNHSKVHTHWTQKGRLFIYDLLKADGVLPIIERNKMNELILLVELEHVENSKMAEASAKRLRN